MSKYQEAVQVFSGQLGRLIDEMYSMKYMVGQSHILAEEYEGLERKRKEAQDSLTDLDKLRADRLNEIKVLEERKEAQEHALLKQEEATRQRVEYECARLDQVLEQRQTQQNETLKALQQNYEAKVAAVEAEIDALMRRKEEAEKAFNDMKARFG